MHTSTWYFSLLFFVILFKVFQNIKRNKEIYTVYFICIVWVYLMSRSLFSDISATRITLYLLTGKSYRLHILTCLKPTSLASMFLLSAKFNPRHRSSHPKTSLNSLTPHRNNISGQRGSKPRVSEHESSALPVARTERQAFLDVYLYPHLYTKFD